MSQSASSSNPVVIVAAQRTPMGAMMGALSPLSASELGSAAILAALRKAGLGVETISEVLMGCVLQAGQGQAPARQAALKAGLPHSVPCTTVNKMCGSGLKTIMMAFDTLHAQPDALIVAGGMESMSNAPYLLTKGRGGYRYGHNTVFDHMALDGLEDAYARGTAMGVFAEATAKQFQFKREQQDAYAVQSLNRAIEASVKHKFKAEIAPVNVNTRKGMVLVEQDEQPLLADSSKIPKLKPAFIEGGTVTAASSASISDGAAALVLTRKDTARHLKLSPRWKIVAHVTHAQEPQWFTTAPVQAVHKLLALTKWKTDDVDVWEINEAFAVVALYAIRTLLLNPEKVNIFGGACALGHPIGASGARLVVTLLNALEQTNGKRGVAVLCVGGGEAVAVAVERLEA